MKKAIFLGLLFVLIVPFTSHAALDANLKYGMKGDSVTELQEFLTDQGVYSGPVTGNFYSLTLAAVKAFQAKQNVSPISGYWGPLSRAKAQSLLDLNISDNEEKVETGTVTPDIPTVAIPVVPIQPAQDPVIPIIPSIQTTTSVISGFMIPAVYDSVHDSLSSFYSTIVGTTIDSSLSCSDQINSLRYDINTLRNIAAGEEGGYLTGGSIASVAQGRADQVGKREETYEASLYSQLTMLMSNCPSWVAN